MILVAPFITHSYCWKQANFLSVGSLLHMLISGRKNMELYAALYCELKGKFVFALHFFYLSLLDYESILNREEATHRS